MSRAVPAPALHRFAGSAGRHLPDTPLRAHEHAPAPERALDAPPVVVLPIQGGDYDVSRTLSERFARGGLRVLRFERRAEWLDASRPLEALPALLSAYVDDVSRAIDAWAPAESGPVSLFGVSMGAMVGTLVVGRAPERFHRVGLALGGSDLGAILATANDPEVNAFRRAMLARAGGSLEALSGTLEPLMRELAPAAAASSVPTDRTWVVAARFDRVVRWPLQVALWEALGRPARMVLPTGHYSAGLFVGTIVRRAVRHLAGPV